MARVFAPLLATHPLVREKVICPFCGQQFKQGDLTTLVAVEDAPPGQWTVEAIPVHAKCAEKGKNEPEI